jgi:hypothetical protein
MKGLELDPTLSRDRAARPRYRLMDAHFVGSKRRNFGRRRGMPPGFRVYGEQARDRLLALGLFVILARRISIARSKTASNASGSISRRYVSR